MRQTRPDWVRKLAAVIMVGGLVLIVGVAGGRFLGWFDNTRTVTLDAPRAGLVMNPDAKVKLRGVQVGKVASIEQNGDHARLTLHIDTDDLPLIPANVRADIKSNTVFGAKAVNLVVPSDGAQGTLRPGATITADHVVVELNTVYQQLVNVLAQTEPDKTSTILGAVDGALSGRGEAIGQALEQLTGILGVTNKHLPQLNDLLEQAAGATDVYADAMPDLTRILDGATTVGDTLVAHSPGLDALLINVTGMGNTAGGVLGRSKDDLMSTLTDLHPVTSLLGRQAPGLRCFITAASDATDVARPLLGGRNGMLLLDAGLIPGQDPYRYPQDLPAVRGDGPPTCEGGLSDIDAKTPVKFHVIDNAEQPYQPRTEPKVQPFKLFNLLFGGPARG
ncbi:MAG: MCE family protein [Gordonia sp. (in: high G+C Gram-positive bacteria)]|uniref:MCE family protein n=1 Tax=Gordonia sp. (in: high G+C Gram-positive bacteria) TaxID=84139 RepID=UPI0039E606F5